MRSSHSPSGQPSRNRKHQQRCLEKTYKPRIEELEARNLLSFAAPISLHITPSASVLKTADFNNDDRTDLAVLGDQGGSLSIYLGQGNGTFSAAIPVAGMNYYAESMTVGDVNNDGRPDLILQEFQNFQYGVETLLDNGDGTFQAPSIFVLPQDPPGSLLSPQPIATGDFNQDGKLDVAVGLPGAVQVLLGNGDESFAAGPRMAAANAVHQLAAGDMNGDGKVDLAFVPDQGSLTVLLGNGDGTFQPGGGYTETGTPNTLLLVDFNGDGRLDVALGETEQFGPENVSILLNNGDGSFRLSSSIFDSSLALTAADFNGDGRIDLVTAGVYGPGVSLGWGDGTFQSPITLPYSYRPDIKAIADFNGDHLPDLIAQTPGDSAVLFVNQGIETHFDFHISASDVQAGTPVTLTLAVRDKIGNVITDYVGRVNFDGDYGLPYNYTFTAADHGSHTFSLLFTNEFCFTMRVAAADNPGAATSASINIHAGPATRFDIWFHNYPTITAGGQANVDVSARDEYGNVVKDFTGIVHLTSSDSAAVLPADLRFDSSDIGSHATSVTLETTGPQTVTATLVGAEAVSATVGISVLPPPPARLVVGTTGQGIAGVGVQITVTALDGSGNVMTGYAGTILLQFTTIFGWQRVPYTFTAADLGIHNFILNQLMAGIQTVSVTDAYYCGINGSTDFLVQTGAATHFLVSVPHYTPNWVSYVPAAGWRIDGGTSESDPSAIAGLSFVATVYALDDFGNVVPDYVGTVHLANSDSSGTLPTDYTFTAGDQGIHTFTVTLGTLGAQALTAADVVTGTMSGATNVMVNAPSVIYFDVSAPTAADAGVAFMVTVTARDQLRNLVSGYTGSVRLEFWDGANAQSIDYTFTTADSGSHTFQMSEDFAGGQSLWVWDQQNHEILGYSSVFIRPGPATHFLVWVPDIIHQGMDTTVVVEPLDQFGNLAIGYTGTVHFTSTDGQAVMPGDYQFSAMPEGKLEFDYLPGHRVPGVDPGAPFLYYGPSGGTVPELSGVVAYEASLMPNWEELAGPQLFFTPGILSGQTITVTDTQNPSLTGSTALTVARGQAASFAISCPDSVQPGVPFSITVTALDAGGNVATGYADVIHFFSSDAHAGLPSDYVFTADDHGVHTFTVTLTDPSARIWIGEASSTEFWSILAYLPSSDVLPPSGKSRSGTGNDLTGRPPTSGTSHHIGGIPGPSPSYTPPDRTDRHTITASSSDAHFVSAPLAALAGEVNALAPVAPASLHDSPPNLGIDDKFLARAIQLRRDAPNAIRASPAADPEPALAEHPAVDPDDLPRGVLPADADAAPVPHRTSHRR